MNPFDGTTPGAAPRLRIEVQNLHFNDLTIWAMRSGVRVRVGRVGGKDSQTFSIDIVPAAQSRIMIIVCCLNMIRNCLRADLLCQSK